MRQVSVVIAPGHQSLPLILTLKLVNRKPESTFTDNTTCFYKNLPYRLNKEDELDKTLYPDETDGIDVEEEFDVEEESALHSYEEGYEYDYHRHK